MKIIAALMCACFVAAGVCLENADVAEANSAMMYWRGVPFAGTYPSDADCPLEVSEELLTFKIGDLPEPRGYEGDKPSDYVSSVTARYTFFNPSDSDVSATLVFPFGGMPSYVSAETYAALAESPAYGVSVNGEEVPKTLRHTYFPGFYTPFDAVRDVGRLSDGYVEDDFYKPDTPVRKYVFRAEGISPDESSAYAAVSLDTRGKTRVLADGNGYGENGNVCRVGKFVGNGDEITICAIGEPLKKTDGWTVYRDAGEKKKIDGSVRLVSEKSGGTLEEYLLSGRKEDSPVSVTDWYNAAVALLNESLKDAGGMLGAGTSVNPEDSLMLWYQYELSVPAGGSAVNEVRAPVWPDLDGSYDPPVYRFRYLLSPAKTWKSFGELKIAIETSLFLTDGGGNSPAKTEKGYEFLSDGLPDGELEFSLCRSLDPAPVSRRDPRDTAKTALICVFVAGGFVAVVISCAILIAKKRKASS